MAIIARRSQQHFDPVPEGLHQCVCVDVIDLGMQPTSYGEKHKVKLVFELDLMNQQTGERYLATRPYTLSLDDKATLLKDLQSWLGELSGEERDAFDLESLIGINALIKIVHRRGGNGHLYWNIESILPLGKNMPQLYPKNYTRGEGSTALQ